MSLANCKRCGTLIPAVSSRLCVDCLRDEEEAYQVVRDYVRQHPTATVLQVSKETGVSVPRIYDFVRKGKLVAQSPDSDLAVECVVCGRRILSGRVCDRCRGGLKNGRVGEAEREPLTGRLHFQRRTRRSQ